jgi:dTDP-D-glucose 4,6-dehydratase
MALRVHRLVTGDEAQERPTALHHTSDRPGPDYVCAVDKARQELGFDAQVDLDGGLLEEIAWFASNPHLWRRD